jgi:hypothetical protein
MQQSLGTSALFLSYVFVYNKYRYIFGHIPPWASPRNNAREKVKQSTRKAGTNQYAPGKEEANGSLRIREGISQGHQPAGHERGDIQRGHWRNDRKAACAEQTHQHDQHKKRFDNEYNTEWELHRCCLQVRGLCQGTKGCMWQGHADKEWVPSQEVHADLFF